MLDWITNTIAAGGYWGIAFLMLLENILPPIPSELIMPLAGLAIHQGKLNFVLVVLAGTLGSVVGAIPWYYIGKHVGEKRLRRWADRHGKWLTLSGDDIDHSKQWFGKYGGTVVLFGRLIPGIRTYISIPAGLEEMPWVPFLLYSTLGTVCWVTFLASSGLVLGQNYHRLKEILGPISTVAIATLFLLSAFWIIQRWRKQKI